MICQRLLWIKVFLMPQLAISLNISEKQVIVIGGGRVAARKCIQLIRCRSHVTVIAPELAPTMLRLVRRGWVKHCARRYQSGDLDGAALVFAATDSVETNRSVAEEAVERGILVNAVNLPEASSFSSPAMVVRGDLVLTASTNGRSPVLARKIRRGLAMDYGREYAMTVRLLGAVREKLLTRCDNRTYNKQILNDLAESDVTALLKSRSFDEIDRLLLALCGPEFSLEALGLRREVT
jgi:precorrin-2 dehydrogenase/sirohydrochlorin ferrochelatase